MFQFGFFSRTAFFASEFRYMGKDASPKKKVGRRSAASPALQGSQRRSGNRRKAAREPEPPEETDDGSQDEVESDGGTTNVSSSNHFFRFTWGTGTLLAGCVPTSRATNHASTTQSPMTCMAGDVLGNRM